MGSNPTISDFEKAFYNDGFQMGMEAVKDGLSAEALQLSISKMYAAIDELIASVSTMAVQQKQTIDCKKGCDFCCYQPVFALDYELDFLNSFVLQNFSEEEQKKIKIQANNNRLKLAKLSDAEILNSKQACPILKNGACSAYTARPMACRIYLSSEVKSCQIFYNDPKNTTSYPALLDFPMRVGRMMNEGFKSALKFTGEDPQEFRIDEKILND